MFDFVIEFKICSHHLVAKYDTPNTNTLLNSFLFHKETKQTGLCYNVRTSQAHPLPHNQQHFHASRSFESRYITKQWQRLVFSNTITTTIQCHNKLEVLVPLDSMLLSVCVHKYKQVALRVSVSICIELMPPPMTHITSFNSCANCLIFKL